MLDQIEMEQEDFYEENQNDFTVVDSYLKKLKKFKILKRSEEIELFERYKNGDEAAREEIINKNLRLVVSIAKRYVSAEVKMEDLISVGNIGLIECLQKYDPRRSKFSTFATYYIKKNVFEEIENNGRTVRVPRSRNAEIRKAIREDFDPKNVLLYGQPTLSMHHIVDDGVTVQDTFINEGELTENKAIRLCYESILREAIERLSYKERYIIVRRFGFNCEEDQTLNSIGLNFGISRERVRQIEVVAMNKIKNSLKKNGINKEDLL